MGFMCYLSAVERAQFREGGGCAAAGAFAADAEFTWLWWDYELAVAASGCFIMMYEPTAAIYGHGLCEGESSAGAGYATFGCNFNGGAVQAVIAGCPGVSAAIASDDCAEASAAAHVSNGVLVVQMADFSAEGQSAGCTKTVTNLAAITSPVPGRQRIQFSSLPASDQAAIRSGLLAAARANMLASFDESRAVMVNSDTHPNAVASLDNLRSALNARLSDDTMPQIEYVYRTPHPGA